MYNLITKWIDKLLVIAINKKKILNVQCIFTMSLLTGTVKNKSKDKFGIYKASQIKNKTSINWETIFSLFVQT
jgi:hypothetical protein